MRVFLDANVLFSASNDKSHIGELVSLLIARGYACTSDIALEEAYKNLALKRAHWVNGFKQISQHITRVETVMLDIAVDLDEKDAPLLSAAIHASCDYFATGDKYDFGHLYGQKIKGVEVVTVKRLAELFADMA